MNDWITAGVGAVVAVLIVLRWRHHHRSRDFTITVDWHSRARDDSTEGTNHDPDR